MRSTYVHGSCREVTTPPARLGTHVIYPCMFTGRVDTAWLDTTRDAMSRAANYTQ